MKTNYFIKEKSSIYTLFGVLALVLTSCGSYQNKSYYDNDGIYASNEKRVASETNSNSAYYKEYFSSLNRENEEIFTNVDEYNSFSNDTVSKRTATAENTNYSGWGSNTSNNITVNVYDNGWNNWGWNNWGWNSWGWNNWGWNNWYGPGFGLGWNSWYGPGFGLGWNNWYGPGWGWYGGWYGNNWGWNNNWYGNNYAYSYGRRDSRVYNNYSAGRTSNNRIDRSINSSSRRNTSPTFTNRNNTVRDNSTRNNSNNTTRPVNNTPRNYNNTSTPRNNSTPRNVSPSSTPRTYSPSNNSGGGRSYGGGGYGGGGGGRSSGGGGGRR